MESYFKFEVVELFAVHIGDGERSSGIPTWFYTDKQTADAVAEGRGWYGGNATVSKIPVLRVGNHSYYLLQTANAITVNELPVNTKDVKEKALAKLTVLEKKVLGLS